ncbi:MAG: aromatic ring-hydroxylating dioxygenase subunit alpha [Pseudomonadota bacterium]
MTGIATLIDDTPDLMRQKLAKERKKHGFAIDPYFYRSHLVYEHELSSLVFKSWIYAAHVSEIPNPGDFVQFEIGEDALIIVRDKTGDIHALFNVCRHRGARVCAPARGNTKTFVCPYHAWTYNTDGTLRSARHMEVRADFKLEDFPLKRARIAIFMGLIFINCDPEAKNPLPAFSNVSRQLSPYNLDKAKIAHQHTYQVDANWKFCLENYQECYHCGNAHRSYARMHTLQDLYCNVQDQVEAMWKRAPKITGAPGIEVEHQRIYKDAESFGACVAASRYGLYDGYLTGSDDGKPVAPLMGAMKGYDGGAGDFQFGPLTFMLNYPDHCVLYRFIPRALTKCDMKIVWFVNGDAKEGDDYDVERVTDLWHNTTLEDEFIIKRNSAGANSRFFTPGPYHPEFEETLQAFVDWYIDTLTKAANPA